MNTAKLKAVPRHSVDGYGRQDISYNDPEGEFVFYSDYEALIAALEAAEKRGADMEVACELFAESKLAQIKLEAALGIAQQRLAELEARNLEVIIPPRRCHDYASVAVQQRDEQWYKALHDACDRAGINLETGGE